MKNYFNLPQYQGAGAVDFSPINNALDAYQRTNERNALMAQRQEEQTYQRGRDARQDQRQESADARQQVEWFGKTAAAIDRLDGPQRAAAWQAALRRHPNAAGLGADYLDPVNGPKLVMAEAGQWRDPREDQIADLKLQGAQLDNQYRQAQIGKLNADAQDTGSAFGKTGQVFQDPATLQFYSVQFGADGTRKIEPLTVNGSQLAPARGTETVGDMVIDKATGRDVRNIGGALERGETAKAVGRGVAEGRLALPKTEMALKQYQAQDKVVIDSIGQAIGQANGWTTGLTGAAASRVPGTAAHNLRNTLNTIKSNLGFDKLQSLRDNSPTGGALGQVSEQENILLQSTWGSVEQSQSQEQLVQNLNRIKAIREQFATLKQQAYEQDVARFGAAAVPNPDTGAQPGGAQTDLKAKYGLE